MKTLTSILLITAIGTTIFSLKANSGQDDLPHNYTGEIHVDGEIKVSDNPLDISSELRNEISETMKKDYIVFHEQLWGKLPKADKKDRMYRIEKNEKTEKIFIANLFDDGNLALLSSIENKEYIPKVSYEEAIFETLKYGILPSLYRSGVSHFELGKIEIINFSMIDNNSHIFRTVVKFRGQIIETHYILERESRDKTQRLFSISKKI